MQHLLALCILAASLAGCLGYGLLWLRLLPFPGRCPRLRLITALALGMGTLAYLILAVGLLGFLVTPVLLALVGAGWVLALVQAAHLRMAPPAEDELLPEEGPLEKWLALGAGVFTGLLTLVTLVGALAPVGGLDWDSLSYHLAAPKIYLRQGRIGFIGYDSHTHFPFTLQMLYTLGLDLGTAPTAKLFHWSAGWLTALAVGFWTARLEVGGRRTPSWAGPVAAAIFAGMPLVLWELGTSYVDLGTALFQFLAVALLLDSITLRGGRPEVNPAGAALAGVLSGFALGTKMTALLQFGLLGLGLLWAVGRAGGPGRATAFRATLVFGALGVLIGSPWYVKSWLWTHNPVYPFFYGLFPQSYSWTAEAAREYAKEQKSFGRGLHPAELAKVFWNLGLHGRAFFVNMPSIVGDKVGSLGPVWAGVLPLVFWARGLGWRVGALLLYGLASIAVWCFLSQQVRYLMPVFAPLAVAAAAILAALPSRALRVAAGTFTALALIFNLGMHALLLEGYLPVVTGQSTEAEYLASELGGLYDASVYVNQLPPQSRVAMYQETRGFYFDRDYFWANPLQHDLIPYRDMRNGDELADALRKFRITHVLINYDFVFEDTRRAHWYRLLMDAVQRRRLDETFRSRGAEFNGRGVIVYRLQ